MTDWVSASASAATAAGTLVLAVATFSYVRSAHRAARATEAALLAAIRPVLLPSRLEDPSQKIVFIDNHWVHLPGGQAAIELTEEAIYLLLSLRNVGNGLAVLDRWDLAPGLSRDEPPRERPDAFRRLARDIYVPAGDLGFWQGALRDTADPLFAAVREAVEQRQPLTLDLLYGDHEGGQRTISRFALRPGHDGQWLPSVARHWNLDRPNPR